MDNPIVVVPVKQETAVIKAEDSENTECVDSTKSPNNTVQTVVLQNIQIHGGEELPIIFNNFSENNSDGNLEIASSMEEEDVIHTYIIE